MSNTLRINFPLAYLNTAWIDSFDGYENHIGEMALVIPGGCGGSGYNYRKIEAYPYPDAFMRDCVQVSYRSARAEDGVQMCAPKANPHEVIPVSMINSYINMGVDIINIRKKELRALYPDSKKLEYYWKEDPAYGLWIYLANLAGYSEIRFEGKWDQFRENGSIHKDGCKI